MVNTGVKARTRISKLGAKSLGVKYRLECLRTSMVNTGVKARTKIIRLSAKSLGVKYSWNVLTLKNKE